MKGVRQLAERYGAEAVVNAADSNGYTCLHWAASGAAGDLAWFLLDNGANPDAVDQWRSTPIHYAAAGNKLENVEILLHFKADASFGKSAALFWTYDNDEIVRLLLQNGAEPDERNDNWTPNTPFMWAVRNAKLRTIRELVKWMEPSTIPVFNEADLAFSLRYLYASVLVAIQRGREERKSHIGESTFMLTC